MVFTQGAGLTFSSFLFLAQALEHRWRRIRDSASSTNIPSHDADRPPAYFIDAMLHAHTLGPGDPNAYMALAQGLMSLGYPEMATQILLPIAQDVHGWKDPFYQYLHVNAEIAAQEIRRLRKAISKEDLQWRVSVSDACSGQHRGVTPNSAVAYLTSDSSSDLSDLAASLQLLRRHLFDVHGEYPVIIFHDSLAPFHMRHLQSALGAGCPLSFQHVSLEANVSSKPSGAFRFFHQAPQQGVGYRSMCRFFSGPLFEHPVIRDLQYYMRMDTDSFFLHPLPYDPFQHIMKLGAVYGYLTTATEEGAMCDGLAEQVIKTAEGLGVRVPEAVRGWDRSFFYNNFEVTAVQFWRSDTYRALFASLDDSGGFLARRWGDGPVRTIALSLLARQHDVVKLTGISYWHQNFVTLPIETEDTA